MRPSMTRDIHTLPERQRPYSWLPNLADRMSSSTATQEKAVYAARGDQHLDFFCHIDHIGKKTNAEIDIKGALADTAKKIFRGTLNFKKGCSGSVGDEGDYAIQLDPHTKNISLPLLKTMLWGITHPAQDSSMPIRFTSS